MLAQSGLARTNGWNRSGFFFFFTAAVKRFDLNGSDRTEGCFTAAFCQTQYASFSGQSGDRSAVGGVNGTRMNITALRAQAAKQPQGHKSSSAVPSKSTHRGSRLQDF